MYSSFQIATKYAHYWLTASNGKGHGIHSPFVYDLIKEVFNAKEDHALPEEIENLRKALLRNDQMIEVEDFGAGSTGINHKQRSIKEIARRSLKSPRYARLLYRLAQYVKAEQMLELGTSLGITSAYLAASNPAGRLVTFEGADRIADLAAAHFERLHLKNIQLVRGNFDHSLPDYLHASEHRFDFIYIDGNHTCEATVRYFKQILPFTHEHTLMIFDDIHWSSGMEQAWKEIRAHPSVTLTIDLFFVGLVFFRTAQRIPQHFRIRF